MLQILRKKLEPEGLLPRIRTHRCGTGLNIPPRRPEWNHRCRIHHLCCPRSANRKIVREIAALLRPGGTLFYTEPPFIVPGREFRDNLALAEDAGLALIDRSFFFVNRAALLREEVRGVVPCPDGGVGEGITLRAHEGWVTLTQAMA